MAKDSGWVEVNGWRFSGKRSTLKALVNCFLKLCFLNFEDLPVERAAITPGQIALLGRLGITASPGEPLPVKDEFTRFDQRINRVVTSWRRDPFKKKKIGEIKHGMVSKTTST